MAAIKVSVQAEPRDIDSWSSLARRLESSGFEALVMGDHPGAGASPWPALGAAAAVTATLKLGTYVLQCGVREPVQAAADAATLDMLAPGRVLFGLGAGHTFREWEATGRSRPSPADRAGRLAEFVDAVARLLDGETVTTDGRYMRLVDAFLEDLPVAGRVRLVVGGGNPQVLRVAAARADVVALSGLGRTRPDGHRHEVRWASADLDAQLNVVHEESERCGTAPEIEALVQVVTVTNDRPHALADLSERLQGVPVDDLGLTPFALVGTVEEMAAQLGRQAEQLGITRYVVREPAIDPITQVLSLINGHPQQ
jgi:probable F420-dependent oxidoreductase